MMVQFPTKVMVMVMGSLVMAAAAATRHAPAAQAQELFELSLTNDFARTAMPTPDQLRDVSIDPELRAYVTQLDDASFKAREEATQRLLDAATDKLQLYALLAANDLSTEQRYRLVTVVREHLIKTPRGAIGISMNPVMVNPAGQVEIRVTELLPGLPAERVLQIGDRILQVDGMPLRAMEDLLVRVQSKRPGEKVHLSIRRAAVDEKGELVFDANNEVVYQALEVDLELGSADLLKSIQGQPNRASPVEQSRQFEAAQASRRYAPHPRPIEVRAGAEALLGSGPESESEPSAVLDQADLDRYPALRRLLLDRRRIALGEMAETRMLRESWKQQLAQLHEWSQRADLSDEQRASVERAIQLYLELMDQ